MAHSRGRPSGGQSIISMLSDRYKEPDTSRTNMVGAGFGPGAGKPRPVFGQPGGGGVRTVTQQRTEETTYSFSQEEEIQQDGRTVYKTKEEKSFSEKPRPWPGENASTAPKVSIKTVSLTPEKPRQWPGESAAPVPKVSIKTITLSSSPKGDGQPAQLTNNFTVGGLQRDGFGPGPGQPHRQQDYQYQQTITTKTVERSGGPQQQPQIRQIQQQSVYQQQKQPVYGQQRQQQQPGYGQQPQPQQQQTTYTQQQQQTTYTQQQQQTGYGQQQQQPGYGQQKQPGYGQQSFVQMQQAGFGQQKQPSYGQQQQKQQQQQRPQQQQQQQQQQQPSYGQQKQQPSFVQMQQASFGQQKQPSYGQQQPQQQPQQQQQQQPSYGQQKQPSHGQQQQPSLVQMQQASFGQKQQQQPSYTQKQQPARVQQPQQPQQQPSRAQPKEFGYTPQIQPSYTQQQQTIPGQQQQPRYGQQPQQPQQPTYGQQKPAQPQPQPQPQQQQQQQQQQRSSYQQQQVTYQQQQQRSGQPQQQQSAQQSVSTVRSEVYRQGQPSVATITTVTSTSSTKPAAAPAPGEPFPWDEPEEGVHENEPEVRTDLVRESDRNWQAELPSVGQARNLKQKFLTGNLEHRPASYKKELTPPGMASGGVFENEPLYNPDVVHYGEETQKEALPEHGTARYMAHRFKEMEKPVYPSGATPGQRQITPDRTTRGEYVSEPRGHVEKYEGRPESGVFESEPVFLADVVKADEYEDDRLPECGLARNIAAHFRQVGSYRPLPAPSMPKEFTPPREDGTMLQGYGVYENTPQYDPTVVHAEDLQRDVLPERGMARTIVTRFRTWSSGDNTPKSPRTKKEFTPPRDGGGVYENEPTEFIPEYNLRPESGILENQPEVRYDVVRANQPPPHEVEFPERGLTRNLVSSWRYKESSSSHVTPTGSGRMKEFTPPREEPRVLVYRSSSVGYDGFGASDGSVHPYDLPGQYQPMEEASVFESEPVYLEHVVREADTDWMEGMPRQDTTRKMVAKFRHIQQQAATDPDFASPAARPPLPAARQAQNLRY